MSFNLKNLNMTCAPMYNAQSNNEIIGYMCNSREGFQSSPSSVNSPSSFSVKSPSSVNSPSSSSVKSSSVVISPIVSTSTPLKIGTPEYKVARNKFIYDISIPVSDDFDKALENNPQYAAYHMAAVNFAEEYNAARKTLVGDDLCVIPRFNKTVQKLHEKQLATQAPLFLAAAKAYDDAADIYNKRFIEGLKKYNLPSDNQSLIDENYFLKDKFDRTPPNPIIHSSFIINIDPSDPNYANCDIPIPTPVAMPVTMPVTKSIYTYDNSKTYQEKDIVIYKDNSYILPKFIGAAGYDPVKHSQYWLPFKPNYDNFVTYGVNDIVLFQNNFYIMTVGIGAAGYDPIGNPAHWKLYNPTPYAYDNSKTYKEKDVIIYNGKSYILPKFIGAAGYNPINHKQYWLPYKPNYDNFVTYKVNDIVTFDHVFYIMTVGIGAAGYAPPAYPAHWTLYDPMSK